MGGGPPDVFDGSKGVASLSTCYLHPPVPHQGSMIIHRNVTLDFDMPYKEQLRPSDIADRNYLVSPMCYLECKTDVNFQVDGMDISEYINSKKPGTDNVDTFMGPLKPVLLDAMARGLIPMFRHLYYEPAGGNLDGPSPEDGLTEAFYSLRQDVGAATGTRNGLEEYVIEWGPLGDNGKGTKRAMREHMLGKNDRCSWAKTKHKLSLFFISQFGNPAPFFQTFTCRNGESKVKKVRYLKFMCFSLRPLGAWRRGTLL